ncbi:twin-arginine translocation signal domain-containing protein [Hymenobacter coccineus]|nr:twin-arginine translocation signal domain-containing protein [Hymenobacter coccineus]
MSASRRDFLKNAAALVAAAAVAPQALGPKASGQTFV